MRADPCLIAAGAYAGEPAQLLPLRGAMCALQTLIPFERGGPGAHRALPMHLTESYPNPQRCDPMTKNQLINDIIWLNRSAKREFLQQFEESELDLYLRKLLNVRDRLHRDDLLEPVGIQELEPL